MYVEFILKKLLLAFGSERKSQFLEHIKAKLNISKITYYNYILYYETMRLYPKFQSLPIAFRNMIAIIPKLKSGLNAHHWKLMIIGQPYIGEMKSMHGFRVKQWKFQRVGKPQEQWKFRKFQHVGKYYLPSQIIIPARWTGMIIQSK